MTDDLIDPWLEHKRHKPTCALLNDKAPSNVPIAYSLASTSAIALSLAPDFIASHPYCPVVAVV